MDQHLRKDILFGAIWEDAHTLVFLLDREGRLTDANPAFTRVTGYPVSDLAGCSPGQMLPGGPRDWAFPCRPGEHPEARRTFSQEWITRGGKVVTVEWSAAPFAGADGPGAFVCTGKAMAPEKSTHLTSTPRDVTRPHEYQRQLAFEEKVLDAVSEAIVATDTHFTVTAWNKGAERIYGWKAEEVLGKDGRQLLQSVMLDGANYQSALETVQAAGTVTARVSQLRKAGQRIPVLSVSNKILDEHHRHIGYLALNRDISELVRMEEELQYRQNLLKTIIDTGPDSIYLLDAQKRVLEINATGRQTFFDRFGVTVAAGDVITEKLLGATVPGMGDGIQGCFRRANRVPGSGLPGHSRAGASHRILPPPGPQPRRRNNGRGHVRPQHQRTKKTPAADPGPGTGRPAGKGGLPDCRPGAGAGPAGGRTARRDRPDAQRTET
jgi:PAS domain S-box-containing protein